MKLLITSGGTREPIDPVRYVSNGSTGRTGAALADALVGLGHDITLLHGIGAILPETEVFKQSFSSTEDLLGKLRSKLSEGDYDGIIMAAAVADYRPDRIAQGKLSSDADSLTLHLVRTPKILPQLRRFSPRPLKVIGFKLTVGAEDAARTAAVKTLFDRGGLDAVVQNDLTEMEASTTYPFRWFTNPIDQQEVQGIPALAETVDRFLQEDSA